MYEFKYHSLIICMLRSAASDEEWECMQRIAKEGPHTYFYATIEKHNLVPISRATKTIIIICLVNLCRVGWHTKKWEIIFLLEKSKSCPIMYILLYSETCLRNCIKNYFGLEVTRDH